MALFGQFKKKKKDVCHLLRLSRITKTSSKYVDDLGPQEVRAGQSEQ